MAQDSDWTEDSGDMSNAVSVLARGARQTQQTASPSLVVAANSRDAVAGHIVPRAATARLPPLLRMAARAVLADRELQDYPCP
jgi:hypothetical protein